MSREMIQPILLFMVAKLAAYTLLGFLLGWLGSMFTFSPFLKGAIQLAVGIFLVGNALRMLNVHPIFRYFSFEPPSRLTRYIRRVSKKDNAWFTPLFLGALTVFIPCGVTQAMMALAISTGSPFLGALIMFAFVLGTSPTFVLISWLAVSLGSMFQKYFYRVVAVIILAMGVYAIDSSLMLVGSPISSAKILRQFRPQTTLEVAPAFAAPAPNTALSANAIPSNAGNIVRIDVHNSGYAPDNLVLPANQAVELHLVTENTQSCSRAFVIPALQLQQLLPETGETVLEIPAQPAGRKLDFMCSMGMYTGVMQFR